MLRTCRERREACNDYRRWPRKADGVRLVPILVAQREQDRRLAAHRLDHGGLGDARGVTRYGVEAQRVESVGEDPRAPSRGCACASRDRARCCESGRTGPRLPVKTLIACARCWPEPQMVYRGYLPKTVYYSHCRKLPTEQFVRSQGALTGAHIAI